MITATYVQHIICPLFAADHHSCRLVDVIIRDITTRENFSKTKKVQPPVGQVSSEDGQVVAALRPRFDRHALVVACYQSVQEAPSLLGKALFAFVDGAPAFGGLAAVPTEADLSDHALEKLGHIVLQRRRRLNELTVKHHCTRSALWEKNKKKNRKRINSSDSINRSLAIIRSLILTFYSDFSGPDQVTLVAHEDDGKVFGLAGASQRDTELRGRIEAGAVRDGVHDDVSTPNLQTVDLRGVVLRLLTGRDTRTQTRRDRLTLL